MPRSYDEQSIKPLQQALKPLALLCKDASPKKNGTTPSYL